MAAQAVWLPAWRCMACIFPQQSCQMRRVAIKGFRSLATAKVDVHEARVHSPKGCNVQGRPIRWVPSFVHLTFCLPLPLSVPGSWRP
jgi:hypothetical protein